jgi:hypothetical protein
MGEVTMSPYKKVQNRLWVQVPPLRREQPKGVEAAGTPAAIVADMIASGIGAIVKSAADRLVASDQYVIKTVLAHEPGFLIRANAASASLLLDCIVLNVGPRSIPVYDEKEHAAIPFDVAANGVEYGQSPVVIRLEFGGSADGTALAARVTHWKYTRFLGPLPTFLRKPRRKITVEVKISDAEGGVLLTTAMQVEADGRGLPNARPNDGERLPWMKRPVRNYPGERVPAMDQYFGPVNIEAVITEVAEPSGFAKFLGTALGSQKAAIEGYLKDRITQASGETEAPKARLASLKEASTAREEYMAAYAAVKEAGTFDTAADETARSAAKQKLLLARATLRQKETLARMAFDRAGLAFEPMPAIKDSP